MGASLFATAACSDVYKGDKLDGYTSEGEVVSNGGFAVEKGDYIYYINGKQSYTADNTYGKVEKGAIMRISKDNLSARNYADVQTVVPEIVYSGNTSAGIFIYGDYVYYSTPSTEKNSDGEIQKSNILFKRARLDGSETMKGYFAKYSNNSIQYRYVLGKDKVVYLLYVATSEDLYGTSCTNIHSVNTETGKDTVLVYNVGSVMFDSVDLTNPRIFYTMSVKDFKLNTSYSNYNQVYTVTAEQTEPVYEYDFSDIEDYDADEDPLYINYGTLVLDGIGWVDGNLSATQFNAQEVQDANKEGDTDTLSKLTPTPYTYSLSNYQNGTLFYSRSIDISPSVTDGLFAVSESTLLEKGHQPALGNPEDYECLVSDASSASNYTYIFDGDTLTGAFISISKGLVKANVVPTEIGEGADKKTVSKLPTVNDEGKNIDNINTFYLTGSENGTSTVLFTEGEYVYFTCSSNSGSIYSLCYTGNYSNYNQLPLDENEKKYEPVRILDLVYTSDWYKPEVFNGHILFSSETKTMTEYSSDTSSYSHIMVCDVSNGSGIKSNNDLYDLNNKYESIGKKIEEVDEEDYEHLKNAYWYAFFTGDGDYIDKIIQAYVDIGEDVEYYWSKESVAKFKDFIDAKNDWTEYKDDKVTVNYAEDTVTVNGKEVHANRRDYYYSLLGTMTKADAKAYDNYVKDTYLLEWPEEGPGWYESLSKGEKAGFIIGIIFGVLLLAAVTTVVVLIILNKRESGLPVYTKKRIKVDTTDDKSVDVYSTEENEGKTEGTDESNE